MVAVNAITIDQLNYYYYVLSYSFNILSPLSLSLSLSVRLQPRGFCCRGSLGTRDWQFVDQMGSPYLMAIGYGTPVADARTTARSVKPGQYRLWVRSKDWMPQHHPGRFELSLAGQRISRAFGASGREANQTSTDCPNLWRKVVP